MTATDLLPALKNPTEAERQLVDLFISILNSTSLIHHLHEVFLLVLCQTAF